MRIPEEVPMVEETEPESTVTSEGAIEVGKLASPSVVV